jgi:hypothetical protein
MQDATEVSENALGERGHLPSSGPSYASLRRQHAEGDPHKDPDHSGLAETVEGDRGLGPLRTMKAPSAAELS